MCVCLQQLLSPSNIYEVAVSYFIVSRLKSTAAIPRQLSNCVEMGSKRQGHKEDGTETLANQVRTRTKTTLRFMIRTDMDHLSPFESTLNPSTNQLSF